eukprot:2829862-Rhodomonas_salina.1
MVHVGAALLSDIMGQCKSPPPRVISLACTAIGDSEGHCEAELEGGRQCSAHLQVNVERNRKETAGMHRLGLEEAKLRALARVQCNLETQREVAGGSALKFTAGHSLLKSPVSSELRKACQTSAWI